MAGSESEEELSPEETADDQLAHAIIIGFLLGQDSEPDEGEDDEK